MLHYAFTFLKELFFIFLHVVIRTETSLLTLQIGKQMVLGTMEDVFKTEMLYSPSRLVSRSIIMFCEKVVQAMSIVLATTFHDVCDAAAANIISVCALCVLLQTKISGPICFPHYFAALLSYRLLLCLYPPLFNYLLSFVIPALAQELLIPDMPTLPICSLE